MVQGKINGQQTTDSVNIGQSALEDGITVLNYLFAEYTDCKEVGSDDELNKLGVDEGDVHPSKVKQVPVILPQCQHVP